MGFLPRRNRNAESYVDMTPMVDCVFLLLIFFMISTAFVETPGLDIKLPESSSQTVAREPKEIRIYLDKGGRIYHQDRLLSLDQFRELLHRSEEEAGRTTLLLLADREARHGQVVMMMDLAKAAGIGKLAIATEQKGGKGR